MSYLPVSGDIPAPGAFEFFNVLLADWEKEDTVILSCALIGRA